VVRGAGAIGAIHLVGRKNYQRRRNDAQLAKTDKGRETMSSEAPSVRHKRLRRAVIMCTRLLENIAYHRTLIAAFKSGATKMSRPMCSASDNYMDTAVTTWCKLFGVVSNNRHHWRKIVGDAAAQASFEQDMLAAIGCDADQWAKFRDAMLAKRDKFLAHQDDENTENNPVLDLAVKSTAYLHRYVLAHFGNLGNFADLQQDPDAWYAHCTGEGEAEFTLTSKKADGELRRYSIEAKRGR